MSESAEFILSGADTDGPVTLELFDGAGVWKAAAGASCCNGRVCRQDFTFSAAGPAKAEQSAEA